MIQQSSKLAKIVEVIAAPGLHQQRGSAREDQTWTYGCRGP